MAKTILIVEDDQLLREALADKLRRKDYTVSEASDGKQGLETALKDHPDLILLDIVMPVMDGMTMLKQLRLDAWGKQAHIMLLTNLSVAEEVASALSQGVNDYLVKSNWKLEDIVKKIDEAQF